MKHRAGIRFRRRADDRIFDRSGLVAAPTWRDLMREGRGMSGDLRRFRTTVSAPASLPRGDGHPVIVIPAFFCSDAMTRNFRALLSALGYAVEGWNAGLNIGPTTAAITTAGALLRRVTAQAGRPATLVGHSLGGVLCRALASEQPERVRRVVTVCSPFRLPTASPLKPVYRLLSPWHSGKDILLPHLAAPPPVPTTAIYTRDDGVVAWTSCIDDAPGPEHENVEVAGAHTSMLGNPQALRVIAERLARPGRE